MNVGIIGCGNISDAYLKAAPQFPVLSIIACADLNSGAAQAKADVYGIEALEVAALLADPRIDIILNLTTPAHHVSVGLQAIKAGKHVYSEKPLGVALGEGLLLMQAAAKAHLRIGSAPDTFLGGVHQTARAAIDAGLIGDVVAGQAAMMCPGHELWHPNPDFYYQPGGGPLFDMGPYYLTCLINMLGPIAQVNGAAGTPRSSRTIGSGPRQGKTFPVQVPTHIAALLTFANGAQITLTTSFEVWKHGANHIELYGVKGSMIVADPNQFAGEIKVSQGKADWAALPQTHIYGDGNYRILGLADMAQAIVSGRPHRADVGLALHVLEVMEGIMTSAVSGQRVTLQHGCARPAPLRDDLPFGVMEGEK